MDERAAGRALSAPIGVTPSPTMFTLALFFGHFRVRPRPRVLPRTTQSEKSGGNSGGNFSSEGSGEKTEAQGDVGGLLVSRGRVASLSYGHSAFLRVSMSDDSKRRPGRPYTNGRSLLARAPSKPGDELQGGWTREQLLHMDDCFVVAVEAAFRSGLESPASASAVERPRAEDSAPAS